MSPHSLTNHQDNSSSSTAPVPPRPSFPQQFVRSGLFDALLHSREQTYEILDRASRSGITSRRHAPEEVQSVEREDSDDESEDDLWDFRTPSTEYMAANRTPGKGSTNMLAYLNAATVSKRGRGRPRKTPVAKGRKGAGNDEKSRKRPPPQRNPSKDRAPKVQKTISESKTARTAMKKDKPREEANTKKKVGVATKEKDSVIDLTADDSDDDVPLAVRFASREGSDRKQFFEQLRFSTSSEDVDEDVKPVVSAGLGDDAKIKYVPLPGEGDDTSDLFSIDANLFAHHQCRADLKAQSDRATDLEDRLKRIQEEHQREIENLRGEMEAKRAKEKRDLDEAKNTITALQLLQQERDSEVANKRSKLNEELASVKAENDKLKMSLDEAKAEAERLRAQREEMEAELDIQIKRKSEIHNAVRFENDALKTSLQQHKENHEELARSLQASVYEAEEKRGNLEMERDQLRDELQAERKKADDFNSTLLSENLNLKASLKKEKEEHEELMRSLDAISSSESAMIKASEQISNLEAKNATLIAQLEDLREAKRTTLSPAPSLSSSSTDEQTRIENVRKTYMNVKRRYDNLHSVAANISASMRGLDLSSFGEFGKYLRQLKVALDEGPDGRRS